MADDSESALGIPLLTGILLVSLFLIWYRSRDPLLNAIPVIGFSDPILSYISAFRYTFLDGHVMLKEGYEKFTPGLFRIPTFGKWMVLVAGAELMEDVKKAPEDILSFFVPAREFLQTDYTLDGLNTVDDYHIRVIRSKLGRNVAATFDNAHDELTQALREYLPTGEEWVKLSIRTTVLSIVCRISGRVFVGTPLCKDRDYQNLAIHHVKDIMKLASILKLLPKPLKPIVARFLSKSPSEVRRMRELIEPLVKERFAKMEELGDAWDGGPDDMLMWLMNEARGVERSLEGIARRLLMINFASIHTTSRAFTELLYRFLSNPEYIEPLRREVEAVVAEEGWTKAGLDKMHKLDSFLRETQRTDLAGSVGLSRVALRPFTFSNGITIPAGTRLAAPRRAVHTDGKIYTNPEQFDGFRFSDLHATQGDAASTRYGAATVSPEYFTFGLGRHACPGRFFAVNEVKALFAHVVLEYDVKFVAGKGAPRGIRVGSLFIPGNADILFRKRQK